MNFIWLNFELNNGSIAKTLINEEKIQRALDVLNKHTKAWVSED